MLVTSRENLQLTVSFQFSEMENHFFKINSNTWTKHAILTKIDQNQGLDPEMEAATRMVCDIPRAFQKWVGQAVERKWYSSP